MTQGPHRTSESRESGSGYRIVTHDFDVPDKREHEPSGIRAQARETGQNKWNVSVVHGPYDRTDESGSYYRHVSHEQFEGPAGKVKSELRRNVTSQWKSLKGTRPK